MKVYIAAPWVRREEAKAFGKRLLKEGHDVTSRWFYHEGPLDNSVGRGVSPEVCKQQAREDIEDVRRADVLVVLNLEKSEGKAVETGIALTCGIPVISVGQRSNIFQALGIEVPDTDVAIKVLARLPGVLERALEQQERG